MLHLRKPINVFPYATRKRRTYLDLDAQGARILKRVAINANAWCPVRFVLVCLTLLCSPKRESTHAHKAHKHTRLVVAEIEI